MSAFTLIMKCNLIPVVGFSFALLVANLAVAAEDAFPRREEVRSWNGISLPDDKSSSDRSVWRHSAHKKWSASSTSALPKSVLSTSQRQPKVRTASVTNASEKAATVRKSPVTQTGPVSKSTITLVAALDETQTLEASPSDEEHGSEKPPATSMPTSKTELFKKLLLESSRAQAEMKKLQSSEDEDHAHAVEHSSTTDLPASLRPPEKLDGLTPAPYNGLDSDDPLEREKAKTFLRFRAQLLQLKMKVHAADLSAPPKKSPNAIMHFPAGSGKADHAEHGSDLSSGDSHADAAASHGPDHAAEASEHGHTAPDEDPDGRADADHSEDHKDGHDPHSSAEEPDAMAAHGEHASADDVLAADKTHADKLMVDGPIDRMRLANNLYAIGDFPMALNMYVESGKGEFSAEEMIWAEFQAANCLRRLKRHSEASNRYRKLAAQAEVGWISQQSQWWVETLEKIRLLEKSLSAEQPEEPNTRNTHSEIEPTDAHPAEHEADSKEHPATDVKELQHGERHE